MGLAVVAATLVPTRTLRSDAVEEMAPALTEPLSQSKLSSSAASGASPRTSSSTTTTATVTVAHGGTTLLPSADEVLADEQLQEHQQQQQQQQQQQLVVQESLPEQISTVVEGFDAAATSRSPASSFSIASGAATLHEATGSAHGLGAPEGEAMGMSLPVTSGDGGSTTVDDIQNNNNTSTSGEQGVLKQLEQDASRDLVEIALEELHHDAVLGGGDVGGVCALDAMAGTVVDMGTVTAPVAGVPATVLQPSAEQQPADFVMMDLHNAPVILSQPTFEDQQQAVSGPIGLQQPDLSQSSTSSLGGLGVGGGGELGGLMKESADMDQMIRELSTSDIDLLQVLKSFDNNSLLLFSDVDVGNLCDVGGPVDGRDSHPHASSSSPAASPSKDRERRELHADIAKRQAQMQRKYDFLVRRLHKVVARYMGQHVSEEVAGLFEHTQRHWKKREKENAKQLHNNNNNTSGNAAGASGSTSAAAVAGPSSSASEKWLDIIPFQAPPPDVTPTPPEKLKPISANALKTFTKRMEGISTTICSVQSKNVLRNSYFYGVKTGVSLPPGVADHTSKGSSGASAPAAGGHGSGGGKMGYANISNTVPLFERTATHELEQTAGMLHAELRHVQTTFDSDATLSSSGGESGDESMPYANALQEPLTIAERASWKWSKDRGAVASRWTWLMARIADLEYRIRQHSEVLNKVRTKKGPVVLEEPTTAAAAATSVANPEDQSQPPPSSINGYRGQLPGSSSSKPLLGGSGTEQHSTAEEDDALASCSRARPYCRVRFRKRKLLPTHNLHIISKRAARPSNFKCGCQWPLHPCALCTGRQDPTAPRDPPDTMPFAERVALLDPSYHSVLSFPEDISHSVYLEAIMRLPDWQNKMLRSTPPAIAAGSSAASGSSSAHKSASRRGDGTGTHHRSSFFSSGDETAPSSLGKRYTAADGKRKFGGTGSSSSKHSKGGTDRSDSGTKSKKAKSRRDVILQSNRKSGAGYGPDGGPRAGSNGHRNHRNKSRKPSNCYDYYDAGTDGGVGRSRNSSPTPNQQRNERRPRNSYDIDNIVIPYSMAAATRVSLPQYKDIAIPKWRLVDDTDESGAALTVLDEVAVAKLEPATDASQCSTSSSTISAGERTPASGTESSSGPGNDKQQQQHFNELPGKLVGDVSIPPNGTKPATATMAAAAASTSGGYVSKGESAWAGEEGKLQQQQQLFVMPAQDEEDISEEAIMLKHERALQEERKKFRTYMKFPWSRPRANRRTESRAGSSGGNTPDPTSPAPPTPMVEHDSSPACPSTPLTPLDGQELSEANVINALHKSLSKKERRRTVSSKRDDQQAQGTGGAGSTTPDTREVVSPYESLQFPLPDDIFEDMVRSMPDDHIALVEDCISKLTGRDGLPLRRPRHRNSNVLLRHKSSVALAPPSTTGPTSTTGGGLTAGRNRLSSNASCSSTTLSATETDLEEFDDEDLMLARRTETQLIMERLLNNSRGASQQYEIVPPTAKPMLGDEEEDALLDDEETDTGESLFVEEDDPNDPEWHDRPAGSRGGPGAGGVTGAAGGGGLGATGRI